MDGFDNAQVARADCYTSGVLKKFLRGITDTATANVEYADKSVTFTTMDLKSSHVSTFQSGGSCDPEYTDRSTVVTSDMTEISDGALHRFNILSRTDLCAMENNPDRNWYLLQLELGNDVPDRIALQLDPTEDLLLTRQYISRVWPIIREDCFRETISEPAEIAQGEGGGWGVLDQVHVALLILDGNGLMYRLNRAARRVLEESEILRRGKGGIFATNDSDTDMFRKALAECSKSAHPAAADSVVFVRGKSDSHRIPITLSRYVHKGAPTKFVVVTLPIPPSRRRIETLAQQLGLSVSEARVAAFIQRGLSNREAAALAGLKEQTFNTYAKRVLSKLDVSCRSEMARLLTWQATGGRMT